MLARQMLRAYINNAELRTRISFISEGVYLSSWMSSGTSSIDSGIQSSGYIVLVACQLSSSPTNRRILRYASTSRRRHLGSNIGLDTRETFIKHRDNVDKIRAAEQRLSQTNSRSTSTTDFDLIDMFLYGKKLSRS